MFYRKISFLALIMILVSSAYAQNNWTNATGNGSFTEIPVGTYTITASGTDITGQSDGFHYVYKMLTGPGSITVRIVSVDNTNPWAKAGVMIRETLEPDSKTPLYVLRPITELPL